MNIVSFIHQCYIPRLLHRLTDKYNVYSSVIKVCSSVITDITDVVMVPSRNPNNWAPRMIGTTYTFLRRKFSRVSFLEMG
jgi:hypothetical protein